MASKHKRNPPFLNLQVPTRLRESAIRNIDSVIQARTYSTETSKTIIPSLDGNKLLTLEEVREEIRLNTDKGRVAAIAWSRKDWREKQ